MATKKSSLKTYKWEIGTLTGTAVEKNLKNAAESAFDEYLELIKNKDSFKEGTQLEINIKVVLIGSEG